MSRDENKYFFIWMRVGDYAQFRLPVCFATRRDAMLVGKRLEFLSSYTTCKITSDTIYDGPIISSGKINAFVHDGIQDIHATMLGLAIDANRKIYEWNSDPLYHHSDYGDGE